MSTSGFGGATGTTVPAVGSSNGSVTTASTGTIDTTTAETVSTVGGVGGSTSTTTEGSSGETTGAGLGGATSTGSATSMGGSGGALATGGAGGSGGSPNMCPPAEPLNGGQQYCSNIKGSSGNGYGYELWASDGSAGCMIVHSVEATFSAEWSSVDDFLARVGLDYNQTQTHDQIGTITAEFAETKTDDGGLTYIGIYGWTVNPLREFYILDDWGSVKPGGTSSDGTPRDFEGTLTADGETYDVWSKLRENKPAITGDSETFEQYFSIRQTSRQCGTISVSQHFSEWESMGLPLGNLHEVKLLVEAQNNSGNIAFTTARFTVD